MKAILLSCLLATGAATLYAQTSYEFLEAAKGPSGNGPTLSQQAVTFSRNITNPTGTTTAAYAPSVKVTFSLSNLTFSQAASGWDGLTFGGNQNPNDASITAGPIYEHLNTFSNGNSDTNYTAISGVPGGISLAGNYAISMFTSVNPMQAQLSSYPSNGRHKFGTLTLTFNQPVGNPVLHVVGLGGYETALGFSTEFDLVSSGATLSKLDGNANLTVTATKILNTAAKMNSASNSGAASGSILVTGTVSSLVFDVYVKGDGGSPTAQSSWNTGNSTTNAGDKFSMSVSFGGGISGTVYNDNDAMTGGVNGNVMNGVTVTLYASNGTTVLATTTTDANGTYNFIGVAPASYVVAVTPPSGYRNVSSTDATPANGRTNVTTSGSQEVTGINFGINQPPVTQDDIMPTLNTSPSGGSTSVDPLSNDSDPNNGTLQPGRVSLQPSSVPVSGVTYSVDALRDTISVVVPGQGTWSVNPTTGVVTFTAQQGMSSVPNPILYTVVDNAGLVSNASQISIPVALGVTLKQFDATLKADQTVSLRWEVEAERNMNGYGIERSLNGVHFELLGFVRAANEASYTFTDDVRTLVAGRVYYRLKMSELDGSSRYSPVRDVTQTGGSGSNILFPSPVKAGVPLTVRVVRADRESVVLRVIDQAGKQVSVQTVQAEAGAVMLIPVSTEGWVPGMYVLSISDAGKIAALPFIVE